MSRSRKSRSSSGRALANVIIRSRSSAARGRKTTVRPLRLNRIGNSCFGTQRDFIDAFKWPVVVAFSLLGANAASSQEPTPPFRLGERHSGVKRLPEGLLSQIARQHRLIEHSCKA